jgi:hypothetical protein
MHSASIAHRLARYERGAARAMNEVIHRAAR